MPHFRWPWQRRPQRTCPSPSGKASGGCKCRSPATAGSSWVPLVSASASACCRGATLDVAECAEEDVGLCDQVPPHPRFQGWWTHCWSACRGSCWTSPSTCPSFSSALAQLQAWWVSMVWGPALQWPEPKLPQPPYLDRPGLKSLPLAGSADAHRRPAASGPGCPVLDTMQSCSHWPSQGSPSCPPSFPSSPWCAPAGHRIGSTVTQAFPTHWWQQWGDP